jgi:chitin synthase
MDVMLSVIITIIVIRYFMACLFQWFIARRLTKPGGRSNWLAWRSKQGGNDDLVNHIPEPTHYQPISPNWTGNTESSLGTTPRNSRTTLSSGQSRPQTDIVDTELYTIMLVTCYSEGEEGLRTTMDSLSNTTYSNKHKIFFVIADGLITGAGETKSTPDIVVSMMDLEPEMTNPKACSYLAVADGEKQLNMAKVVSFSFLVFLFYYYYYYILSFMFGRVVVTFLFYLLSSMLVIITESHVFPLSNAVPQKNSQEQKLVTVVNVIHR